MEGSSFLIGIDLGEACPTSPRKGSVPNPFGSSLDAGPTQKESL